MLEQEATNYKTYQHIHRVQQIMNEVVKELLDRALRHDQSKLSTPEVELFTEHTPKLAKCDYNSTEYKESLKLLQPALDHHYANNDHHPEHHKNGIDDMNLFQVFEMLVDWKASSERQNNGNLNKSITINANRFNICPQLVKIFENTAKVL